MNDSGFEINQQRIYLWRVTLDLQSTLIIIYRPMVPLQIHASSPCSCGSHVDYSPHIQMFFHQ